MLELMLICGALLLGLIAGVLFCLNVQLPELLPVVAPLSSAIATALAYLALAQFKRLGQIKQNEPRDVQPIKHQPKPFLARLAAYLHIDAGDIDLDRPAAKSQMPFWTILSTYKIYRAKSAKLIREVLLRIQAQLNQR